MKISKQNCKPPLQLYERSERKLFTQKVKFPIERRKETLFNCRNIVEVTSSGNAIIAIDDFNGGLAKGKSKCQFYCKSRNTDDQKSAHANGNKHKQKITRNLESIRPLNPPFNLYINLVKFDSRSWFIVECISSIHFSLFGQSDQKRKNQLSCLFTFFFNSSKPVLTENFFLYWPIINLLSQ